MVYSVHVASRLIGLRGSQCEVFELKCEVFELKCGVFEAILFDD